MAGKDKVFLLRCAYSDCGKETKIMLTVPSPSARRRGKKEQTVQLVRYCEHCHRANVLTVPQSWDGSELVLGGTVVDTRDGTPIVQGERL